MSKLLKVLFLLFVIIAGYKFSQDIEMDSNTKEKISTAAETIKTQTKEIVDKVQQVKREHLDSPEKVLEDAKEKIAKLSKEIDELQASKK